MVQADISGIEFLLPILSFLIVLIICYAALRASKLIEDKWISAFVSIFIATIFVSAVGARTYVLSIIPAFAVVFVCLFLVLLMTGFIGKMEDFQKGVGKVFAIVLIVIFAVIAIIVFFNYISPYFPGSHVDGGNSEVLRFTDWLYSPKVAGAILLIGLGALVSWMLVKSK